MSLLSEKMIELYNAKNDGVYDIEKYLKPLLLKDLYNIDLWLRLAITQTLFPIADEEKALSYIEHVFTFDPNNYKALFLYSEIQRLHHGISQETINKLNNFKFPTAECYSMAQYQISKSYYKIEDQHLEVVALEHSVQLYQGHVHNNYDLGEHYYKHGRTKEALILFKRALKNTRKTNKKLDKIDFTDVDRYIAEFITGLYTTESVKNRIEQAILKCKET